MRTRSKSSNRNNGERRSNDENSSDESRYPFPLVDFFSINRFFYDAIINHRGVIKDIADDLLMNYQALRRKLLGFHLPLTSVNLYNLAKSIETLDDPPPWYRVIINNSERLNDKELSDLYLELQIPVRDYHFDFHSNVNKYIKQSLATSVIKLLQNNMNDNIEDDIIPPMPNYSKQFALELISNYNSLPDVIKNLSDDERYKINKDLSISYLSGKVKIPTAGIASPHLQGTFHLEMRKENTGYMLIDQNIPQLSDIESQMKNVFKWLKENNHLYHNLDEPSVLSLFTVVVETNTPMQQIGLVVNPKKRSINNQNENISKFNVPIKCKIGENYE